MFASLYSIVLTSVALSAALPLANPSLAAPFARRTVTSLDQAAVAQAQQRDDTATRAFTAQEIRTSDGRCFFVDPLSGDFRENLTPIQLVECDGSDGQKWDIITSGKHNNVAGQALVVSSLTNACLNFDDRRAAGNQVLLFSCGGRADGSGQVQNAQLYSFNGSSTLTLQPLSNKGVCLFPNGNLLDQTNCNNSPSQVFTIGGGQQSTGSVHSSSATATATASSETVVTTVSAPSSVATSTAATTTTAAASGNEEIASTFNPSATVSVSRAGGVLNPTAAAEANQRDDTATRAFSSVSLKNSAGQCLFVDPTAGDFREELIPIQAKTCDGSANEQWDIITSGKHDNVANSALIVSTITQGCMNFDPRRAAGDTVIIFSCGGRADGQGQTTKSQLFPLPVGNSILLAPQNGNNQTCLAPNSSGRLDSTNCDGKADQVFTIVASGSGSNAQGSAPAPATTTATTTSATSSATSATTTTVATTTTANNNNNSEKLASSNPSATVTVSRAGGVLNPSAAAEANPRDDTATRAFSSVSLKNSAGQCLFVDPTAGDFRENLIPIQAKNCDGSANEKWDIITAGKHDNVPNSALIVSTITQGCMNFDPRRATGDTVIMFSCGGRADGGGQTTNSQLFPLPVGKAIVLAPQNGNNQTCLTPNSSGRLDSTNCDNKADQVFTIV